MIIPNNDSHIKFGNEVIHFEIERTSRRKTTSISVGCNGVRVLAPTDLNNDRILSIIYSKSRWILKKQAEYKELGGHQVPHEFVNGETFYYLGRQYRLKIIYDPSAVTTQVKARGYTLLVKVTPGLESGLQRASVRGGLRTWYQIKAEALFKTRSSDIVQKININPPVIKVVDYSKRWGSCNARGCIRINWRLVMAPVRSIDYVIAHELCHIVEYNHSRAFWRLLGSVMPDYAERIRDLDCNGHAYVW